MAARGSGGSEAAEESPTAEGFEAAKGAEGFDAKGVEGFEAAKGAEGFEAAKGAEGFEAAKGAEGFEAAKGAEGFEAAKGAEGFEAAKGAEEFEETEGFGVAKGAEEFEEGDSSEEAEPETAEPKYSAEDFEKRLIRVTLWLKKIYKNQPVAVYEVNERTVDFLHDLMEQNEARDRDMSIVIEDMKHLEAEYDAETEEMKDIFKDLGLSLHSLSRKATRTLNDLVKSAMALDTKDTSLTSFFCAINRMTSELVETESENRDMWWELSNIKRKLMSVLMMEDQILQDIQNLEECQQAERARIESRSHNLKFLRDKSLELKIRIRNAEEELIGRGMERSLTHQALVQSAEELVPLRKKVASMRKEVKNFYDLPPSIPLARVKVEEEKLKLNALEEELSKELDRLAFELM
ncbi:HAUS augmin-like complex subunit 1 [Pithys albifrons albifrons]|uniref:HAUS augmin-like complex subunit 1 n=1 Tax=Pithys albifrons albifrons TaxID=3385563 RepID=UPI003A5CB1EC